MMIEPIVLTRGRWKLVWDESKQDYFYQRVSQLEKIKIKQVQITTKLNGREINMGICYVRA